MTLHMLLFTYDMMFYFSMFKKGKAYSQCVEEIYVEMVNDDLSDGPIVIRCIFEMVAHDMLSALKWHRWTGRMNTSD